MVLAHHGVGTAAQVEAAQVGEGFRKVFVDADQGVIHLLAAEDLPVLVVVLDGEAQHPAGPLPLPAFAQQRVEGREVIHMSPFGQVKIRIQEGNEDDHDRHQAEGIHDQEGRKQETRQVSGQQHGLDGQQADDLMCAQFLYMAQDPDGGKSDIGTAAGIQDPEEGPGMEAFLNPEQPVGPGGGQGHQDAGNIDNGGKDPQFGPEQCFRVQHADGEDEEHVGTDKGEDIIKDIDHPQQFGSMLRPGFVQPEGSNLQDLCADVNDQNGKESPVQTDRQSRPEKVVTHDDQQDQHAGENEAVIHPWGWHHLPQGESFLHIGFQVPGAVSDFCVRCKIT